MANATLLSTTKTVTHTQPSVASSTIHLREIPKLIMKLAVATGCKEGMERSQFHLSLTTG